MIFSFSPFMIMETVEVITTAKSMMFQPILRYEFSPLIRKPCAIILRNASNMKKLVKTISEMPSTYTS